MQIGNLEQQNMCLNLSRRLICRQQSAHWWVVCHYFTISISNQSQFWIGKFNNNLLITQSKYSQREQLFAFCVCMRMRVWVSIYICAYSNKIKMLISLLCLLYTFENEIKRERREREKQLKMLIQTKTLCLKNLHAFNLKLFC